MSGERVLLDTNIVIALFADDAVVRARLSRGPEVFVPSIVIGELCFGARKSLLVEQNLQRIGMFAGANTVLPCDVVTASVYGEIKDQLRRQGRPIPENDVWIAALARQHGLKLVSRDGHFRGVDHLEADHWQ